MTQVVEASATEPAHRLRGTILRINPNGYAFVREEHTREEFWLHVREMRNYPSDWLEGVVVEFTPGEREEDRRNRKAFSAARILDEIVAVTPKKKKKQ